MINDQAICRWCARVALLAVCQVILLLSVSDSRGVSIWPTSAVPAVASAPDAVGVEVGVKFESAADGYVTALRFYKGPTNSGTHVGRLWEVDGTLLGSAVFVGETATGWQEQTFATPVAIDSNTTYIASYFAPQGGYSVDTGYFALSGVTNVPLRALVDGEDGGNGVYRYGEGAFPDLSFNSANYWVDIVFEDVLSPDTNAPVVFSVDPGVGQTNVGLNTSVTATFDEPVDAASVTTNTFTLQDATNGFVAATVGAGSAAEIVVLSPVAPLADSATYTATLKSGGGGITDLAGNPLASDFSWSFTTTGPDTNAPTVVSVSPGPGVDSVAVATRVTASFSEVMNGATIDTNTFTLKDASNQLVTASVAYDVATGRATLTPSELLLAETAYTATIAGGVGGVEDVAGNTLATNYTWVFTTMADNPYGDGPGGPILVLTDGTNSFNAYYAEILLTEGLNSFSLQDVSSVSNAAALAGFDIVLVGDLELTGAQVGILSNWVSGGGDLIAMRPDKKLAGLLGLVDAATTLSEGYLSVNTTVSPGAGIVDETMQFHGVADLYTVSDAVTVGTLFSDATTSTVWPAVTIRSVGTNGGQVAAFTYDLARSIVYTRQGNPQWAGQERDGQSPLRSDDLFYGNASFDPQPDWVDLDKAAIPQADEQQRLLANMILEMNMDQRPLPRFWYFPDAHKAVVVMTGDNHSVNGTEARFDDYIAASPTNGSLENWELVRGSSYIYPDTPLSNSVAAAFEAQGFEIALHITSGCLDYDRESLESFFATQLGEYQTAYPSLSPPETLRIHCVAWSGYTLLPEVALQYGIRLDTSYYYWPPGWVAGRIGMFTGSAMPMRFATTNGNVVDVFQATTQMTDESGQIYPLTVDTLLDRALGEEGYYGAYVANLHTDVNPLPESDAVVASCQARGVPVITALQLLRWVDARNSSSTTNITWAGNTLSFSVVADTQARGLQSMVPVDTGFQVQEVRSNDVSVSFSTETIKGVSYAFIPAGTADYEVDFAFDDVGPVVVTVSPTNGASGVSLNTTVSVVFDEAMDAGTITSNTIVLEDGGSSAVAASVGYDNGSFTATLTPDSALSLLETYTATAVSGASGVKDVAGNELASDFVWSFTTTDALTYSIWTGPVTPTPTSDPDAYELGVKFQSQIDGYIAGVRFYKTTGNGGTHIGNLWSLGGSNLASVTFSNETATGWQEQLFASPVGIVSNTTYVASYLAPQGNYAADLSYFTSGVSNPPLYALADGEDGGNGVFAQTNSSVFPTNTFNSANYWVDVVFVESVGPDTNAPVVVSVSPSAGAVGVSVNTTAGVTFNEAMDAATVTNGAITLSNASGMVSSGVSYDAGSFTATLTPDTALGLSESYTARVLSGGGGVKDAAGNELAADYVWSFTTADTLDITLWSNTNTPAVASANDPAAVELGVKFQSGVDGYIAGIRFYKGPTNGGTHTGHLWTLGGSNLASVTFGNETAGGWQEQGLLTPVPIDSNTTYVASYHAPNGGYSLDAGYFSVGGYTNAPLRALPDAEAGGNGVFTYGPAGSFPTNTFNAANYWVDVVFLEDLPNTPPVATNLFLQIAEDTTTNLFLQGSDPESAVSFALLVGATNGVLTGLNTNTGSVNYTPDADYFGPDYWTYTVSDGELLATGSVSVAITAVNDAPVASGSNESTPEDVAANLVLPGSDVDNANLLFSVVDGPTNGLVSGFETNSGALTYTPAMDYNGADSIRYSVSDGALVATGLVSITITPVDDPPKAIDQNVSLAEDTSTNIILVAADIDTVYNLTETLSVAAVSTPDDWSLGAGGGKVSAVALNDGNSSYIFSTTTANTRQQFELTDSASIRDVDSIASVVLRATCKRNGNNANYRLSAVLGGVVQPGATFTAKNNYAQATSDFGSKPGGGGWELTDVAALELRIENLQSRDVRCTQLDALVNYQSDLNTTNVVFGLLAAPTNGVLTGPDPLTGEVTYMPDTNYAGGDAFQFTATIDSVVSTGLVLIGVSAVNDAPVFAATPADVSVSELTLLSVTNEATDIDLPPQVLTYQLLNPPSGALISSGGVITWVPGLEQGPSTNVLGTVVDDGALSATNFFTVIVVDALVVPEILNITATNGVVSLTWSSESGRDYLVEYTDDLGGTNWTPLLPPIQATGATATATNIVTGVEERFYRVKVEGS